MPELLKTKILMVVPDVEGGVISELLEVMMVWMMAMMVYHFECLMRRAAADTTSS
jgi:type IV secretory pathway VirB6-like protein